jgi:TPR repeat protein
MNTHFKLSLSDIRIMILCDFPLSTEEYGHLLYDGDGVIKSLEEAYVWYRVAQCAGNHKIDSIVSYLDATLKKSKCCKLSSRARHIYTRALLH